MLQFSVTDVTDSHFFASFPTQYLLQRFEPELRLQLEARSHGVAFLLFFVHGNETVAGKSVN